MPNRLVTNRLMTNRLMTKRLMTKRQWRMTHKFTLYSLPA
jgi:hypothetical protein